MNATLNPTIEEAKAEFFRAKNRIAGALESTPDDRINWSPAPTARTPIEQVAHAAMSIEGIQSVLMGTPFPYNDMKELDDECRRLEKDYSTREQVLSLLETNSEAYSNWLDSLTPEQLASKVNFGFAEFPMAAAITFNADHLRNHAAQLEYIQTIYGDRDWH